MIAEFGDGHALRAAIDIGRGDVMHPITDELQMGAAIARLAGDRAGEKGAAMIGIMARDEMALLRLAAPALVILDQANRRVIGRRPAASTDSDRLKDGIHQESERSEESCP